MKALLLAALALAARATSVPPVDIWVRAEPDAFSSVRSEALGVDLTAVARNRSVWAFTGVAGRAASFEARREHAMEADETVTRWRLTGLETAWTLERVSRLRDSFRLRPDDGGPSIRFDGETGSEAREYAVTGGGLGMTTRTSGLRTRLSGPAPGLGPTRAAVLGAALVLLRLDPPRRLGT